MIGTPGYMAPEQTRGERVITPAADVFSLGCVLDQCLTGEAPFVADHVMAVLVRILFEEPRPIEELRPECPANLAELTRAMLNKEPDQRPRDAAAVREALSAIARGTPSAVPGSRIALRFPEVGQSLLSVVLATPIADTTENKTAFLTRMRGLAEMVRVVGRTAPVLGVWDTEVRVTIADTLLAAGDRAGAGAALADALHHIALRAANIADGAVRYCYMTQNPFCVRANELAAAFELAPIS